MSEFPLEIADFLLSNHVMGLATTGTAGLWCASVFYCFDPVQHRLIFLTALDTQHGRQLAEDGWVAGTIAGQPVAVEDIRGVQFDGHALLLDGEPGTAALALYLEAFPFARAFAAPVWAVALDVVKFTDNSRGFGHKLLWQAPHRANGERA